ncbi:hypothetical protein, partial [Escherichia coli]|uniref:hypothetical protein n=2 Tax=Escherichia coli TaxID=562 RepID=UPI001951288E
MTKVKLPDALRLSGLHGPCNVLNLHAFVGRIRRLRRIRHKQRALCQQSEAAHAAFLLLHQQRQHFIVRGMRE